MFNSKIKRNELLHTTKIWMGLQIIMLNKTNSAKTQHDLPLVPIR